MRRNLLLGPLFSLAFVLPLISGCGDDSPGTNDNVNVADAGVDALVRPDAYVGPCHDDPVPVFEGTHQTLINSLAIAPPEEGFDLDYDGQIDNMLGLLGSVANGELRGSMEAGDIFLPLEFFDLDSDQQDECLNFVFYIGEFPPDQDDDGERTGGAVGRDESDCNDWDPDIRPGAAEVLSDYVDNNCNGLADESGDATPSTNTDDRDGDGYSLADGDCDDRLPSDWPEAPDHWDPALINPGMVEVCGDGFDNNCNGVADEGCNPLSDEDGAEETISIDASSLDETQSEAIIVFRSARVEEGILLAGPSRFEFSTPIEGRDLVLNLTSAMLEATVTLDTLGLYLSEGMLGGVLNGQSLDQVPNIAPDLLGGDEDSTMLDVIIGPFGMLVALPTIGVCVPRDSGQPLPGPLMLCDATDDCGDTSVYRCNRDVRPPDIDVDGDGIEIYLDLNLDGDPTIERIDTCVDGDGTIFYDDIAADGTVLQHCTQELDGQGNPRFVDGFSIAIKLTSTPIGLRGTFSNY